MPSRRDRYLQAALSLFDEHGFAGTTTDMLVAAVGGSKATLYKVFPSKEALAVGLIEQVIDSTTRDMLDPAASQATLREELTVIGRSACEGVWSDEARAVLRLVLGEYHRMPQLAQLVWERGPAVTYARFKAVLAERERRGEIRVPDRQIAAEQFIGGLVAHVQMKLAFGMTERPSKAKTERRVARAVETFMARYATDAAK